MHGLEKLSHLHAATFHLDDDARKARLSLRFTFLNADFLSSIQVLEPRLSWLVQQQAGTFLQHRFDLLGSGPTVVAHGLQCKGVDGMSYPASSPILADHSGRWLMGRINRTNLTESQRIWQLIGPGYVPIDWQLDFKSGYRWGENIWHRDIPIGRLPGMDIKVPWELGRLQHLPTLALACHFARADDPRFLEAGKYAQEFRNQVLDFISTNPPGFGVNWSCPMDVAIRCANLLVARDMVIVSGEHLDDAFERVFAASILAHARHVVKNLEWSPVYRGNHYLANIVGLLFAAAYLPNSDEVDGWLAFSLQELVAEVDYQFHEDGSNFEASVCYHRLSAEMVLWGFALLSNLSAEKIGVLTQPDHQRKELPRLRSKTWAMHLIPGSDRVSPVPPWCWERLAMMADFTQALTRPDGTVTQFGDNDSGRFLIIGSGEQIRADNDRAAYAWSLDHGSLLAGIRALSANNSGNAAHDDPAAHIVRAFAGFDSTVRTAIPAHTAMGSFVGVGDEQVWSDQMRRFECTAQAGRWKTHFPAKPPGLLNEMTYQAFMGMGCFVFRSPRVYLAVRCGEIGISGLGAHAHCDQLGIELVLDGVDHVRDPGTCIYTASMEKRNAYRSATAHHVPRVKGREPANLNLGPFDLRGGAEGECLYFGSKGFIGRHQGYGQWVYRIIALEDDAISVLDFIDGELSLSDPTPLSLPFSSGYGYPVGHASVPA
ncbi:heparinase II/III family protein [Hydrogenophaga sp.]|uniref:heparinase II/III family protein n=1 Tax=Hydrogenophaga sp. TaxID=1904254 RepID=UPI002FCBE811